MTLDFAQIASQIEDMASGLRTSQQDRESRLKMALETLHASSEHLQEVKDKIERSRTTWLVAGLTHGLDRSYDAQVSPADYVVAATDGSHIEVDRHRAANCFVINIGSAVLRYGQNPDAVLSSKPTLYAGDDLSEGEEELAEGALLGARRMVEECQTLAETVVGLPGDLPILALLDGSLILWALAGQTYPAYVIDRLLDKGLLAALDRVKAAATERRLALASYISLPRSTEVVNALRVAICPHQTPDCDRFCPRSASPKRECDAVAGIQDRELFHSLLTPGQRSASFVNRSKVTRLYGEHQVRFCYLRLEEEIARLEFPAWVEDMGLLDLAHSLTLDQCRRGYGYPAALSEAHEKAVITGAEREQFWELVDRALFDSHLAVVTSAKSRSKRTRWV